MLKILAVTLQKEENICLLWWNNHSNDADDDDVDNDNDYNNNNKVDIRLLDSHIEMWIHVQ